METTGCWLLLAAHFILICQQGKTCYLSCLSSHDIETLKSSHMFRSYQDRVVLDLTMSAQQLQVSWEASSVRNKPKKSPCGLRTCICVRIRNIFLLFPVLNLQCVTRCASLEGEESKTQIVISFLKILVFSDYERHCSSQGVVGSQIKTFERRRASHISSKPKLSSMKREVWIR